MTILTSAAALYRHDPLLDAIADKRELLAMAQRAQDEAEHKHATAAQAADAAAAKAAAAPDDTALRAAADEAAQAAATALVEAHAAAGVAKTMADMLATHERELEHRTLRPVYLLRVPTLGLRTRYDQMAVRLPHQPSDRRLFHAMKTAVADGMIPADDPDYVAVANAFRDSAGASVPDAVAGRFEDLFVSVGDHPAVQDALAARVAFNAARDMLKLRLYLAGIEGLPGAEGFEVKDGLATEASLDIIPPDAAEGILARIDRLGTLRGREGNGFGSPSPSQPNPKRSKTA